MATKLTERWIDRMACPPGKKDMLAFDTEQRGLGVRVVSSGSRTYLAQYTHQGRRHRIALGNADAVTLADARDAARIIMGEVAKGLHPAEDRKLAVAAAKAEAARERVTVGAVIDGWEQLHLSKMRESYRLEAPRVLRKGLAAWLGRPAERLAKIDVLAALDASSRSIGRSIAACGSACFGWAMKRGQVAHNPFEKVVSLATVERERVLTDAELVRVWQTVEREPAPYGPILKLLTLTGQRREEVAGMDWSEVSPDLLMWSIPGDRTKNGLPQDVPLGPAARAILGKPPKRRKGLVFPGTRGKEFGNWSKRKASLDERSDVSDWVLHDIRRTVATNLQRLGARLEVTEAILNHVSGTRSGVAGIYHRHKWTEEKAAALLSWELRLMELVRQAQAVNVSARAQGALDDDEAGRVAA